MFFINASYLIVVLDGVFSLLDLCLERAEAIGNLDAELPSAMADNIAFGEVTIDNGVGDTECPVENNSWRQSIPSGGRP